MVRMFWLVLWCMLGSLSPTYGDVSFQPESPVNRMVVANTGQVYVGAENRIYRLNEDLTVQGNLLLTRRLTNVTGMVLSTNETSIVTCLSDATCHVYSSEDLSILGWENRIEDAAIEGSSIALAAFSTDFDDLFYIGSFGLQRQGGPNIILLRSYTMYDYPEYLQSSETDFTITSPSFRGREFYSAFTFGEFIYFIVMDRNTQAPVRNIRILRVCNETNNTAFSGLYEAILDCGELSSESKLTGFSLVESLGVSMAGVSMIISVSGQRQSHICSFALSDVDQEMEKTYHECESGESDTHLAWVDPSLHDSCSSLLEQEITPCNLGTRNTFTFVPGLATYHAINATILLDFGNAALATFAVRVDDALLIYIAFSNSSSNYLSKFHVNGESPATHVSTEITEAPVKLISGASHLDYIYVATETKILRTPIHKCSMYLDCVSCSGSGDPVCGWCFLENKCSRRSLCSESYAEQRWIHNSSHCISDVQLSTSGLAVDNVMPNTAYSSLGFAQLHSTCDSVDVLMFASGPKYRLEAEAQVYAQLEVQVSLLPSTSKLPELPVGQKYYCTFTGQDSEYSISVPFVNGECQITTSVPTITGGPYVATNFSIEYPGAEKSVVTKLDALFIYNCSAFTSCIQCVEANSVCGWCVYDHICTGNSSQCMRTEDWRAIVIASGTFADVCPVVIRPSSGYYIHPVAVNRDLILHTRNLPQPIAGYGYECVLEYANGTTTTLQSVYIAHSEHPLNCQPAVNQVQLSSTSNSRGTESVKLKVLWASQDGYYHYEMKYWREDKTSLVEVNFERPDVILYDCSQLARGCSSCLAANDGNQFDCGWCSRSTGFDTCSVQEECIGTSVFNTLFHVESRDCPLPVLSSIFPTSGPSEGGTRVTLTGMNLGVTFQDITSIRFGDSPCVADEEHYIPGKQIVCITSPTTLSDSVSVTVEIDRGGMSVFQVDSTAQTYRYGVPLISSVVPLYGPVSGGTTVTVKGSDLNISDISETKLLIAGESCIIQEISNDEIVCLTVPQTLGSGLVQLIIDDAIETAGNFQFLPDPRFTRITPSNTIPIGGITLTFTGTNMDAVLRPIFVITVQDRNFTASTVCEPTSPTTLDCPAPELSLNSSSISKGLNKTILNYTVIVDGAPTPSHMDPNLQLTVKQNPQITKIHEEDASYHPDSDKQLRILGENFDSVRPREVEVFIGSQICNITTYTDTMLKCYPPQYVLEENQDFDVTVSIASGRLHYDIGPLNYLAVKSSHGDSTWKVLTPVLSIMIIALVACIGIAVVLLYVVKTKQKNKRKAVYDDARTTPSENVYDYIADSPDFTYHQPQSPFGKALYSNGNGRSEMADRHPNNYTVPDQKLAIKQRALPAVPPSESDQYIEMHAQSVSSFPSMHSISSSKQGSTEYGKEILTEIEERETQPSSSKAPSEFSIKTQQSWHNQVGTGTSRQPSRRSSRCSMGRVSEYSSLEEYIERSSMVSDKTEEHKSGAAQPDDQ